MDPFFEEQKNLINSHLQSFLRHKIDSQKDIAQWGEDFPERLGLYISHGKMIRGSLCILGYSMISNTLSIDIYKLAAAIELYHSGLLIHDDIIDQDRERRNQKAMHIQYQDLAENENMIESQSFGIGMGISGGDISFFFALESLANINASHDVKRSILNLFSREFVKVGLMEMQDIFWGYTKTIPSDSEIIKLYTYKTGRYTFSLPLMSGAILAEANPELIKQLEDLGEKIGIIYQLLDDKKDLLENAVIKGYEFKKSLYYAFLMKEITDEERSRVATVLSENLLSQQSYELLISLLKQYAIEKKAEELIQSYREGLLSTITTLPIPEKYKALLTGLVKTL